MYVHVRYRELRMPRHESILPIYGLPVRQFDLLLCVEEGLPWNLSKVSVALIITLTYFGAEFEMERATFRPASASLDHAMVVVCGLNHILADESDCRWVAVGNYYHSSRSGIVF